MQELNSVPKRDGRGGARINAGRKPKAREDKNIAVSFSLPPDLAALIRSVPDKSKLIQQLLREHFGVSE